MENSDMKENTMMFHYTTLNNLEKIMKSGYIRLTDIVKSNDPEEGFFAFNAL